MAAKRVRLAQRRKSAGYSQEKLAERLGVERSTVVRWETAESEPQPWLRPRLAAALDVPPSEVQALLDDVTIVEGKLGETLDFPLAHPESADLVAVAHLNEGTRQLEEWYDKTPSTALLGPAGRLHGQVCFLRKNVTNPRVRKSLVAVAAEIATLMGQLVWDVSQRRDHQAAIAYLDEAIAAARQIRDPCAEAYAILRKSFVALYGEKDSVKGLALPRRLLR